MDFNKALSRHVEYMRSEQNIKRSDFVEGIISERQYKRYIAGDGGMTNHVLYELTDRLKISFSDFVLSFMRQLDKTDPWLDEIAELTHLLDVKSVLKKIEEEEHLYDFNQTQALDLAFQKIRLQESARMIPHATAKMLYIELIDYPNLLQKHSLTDLEWWILYEAILAETKDHQMKLYEELKERFESEVIENTNRPLKQRESFIDITANYYINRKEFSKAKPLIQKMINLDKMNNQFHLLLYSYSKLLTIAKLEEDKKTHDEIVPIIKQMCDLGIFKQDYEVIKREIFLEYGVVID